MPNKLLPALPTHVTLIKMAPNWKPTKDDSRDVGVNIVVWSTLIGQIEVTQEGATLLDNCYFIILMLKTYWF